MPRKSTQPFRLSDEPTASSVALLSSALRDDSARGSVSPRMYAHRSRVIRQQSLLLALRAAGSLDAVEEKARRAKQLRKEARPKDHREEGGQG